MNSSLSNKVDALIKRLNSKRLNGTHGWNEDCERLVQLHAIIVTPIVHDVSTTRRISLEDAYSLLHTSGLDHPQSDSISSRIYFDITYESPGKEPITLAILAYFGWSNSEFSQFPNPWTPIVELLKNGMSFTYADTYSETGTDEVVMEFYTKGGPIERKIL